MIDDLRNLVDVAIRLFALGLFVSIMLNWMNAPKLFEFQRRLNRFYDIFLDPMRRLIRPIRFFGSAPVGVDLTPLIFLLILWWLVHPFLLWVLGD